MNDLIKEWCLYGNMNYKISLIKNSLYDILNWNEHNIDCFYKINDVHKINLTIKYIPKQIEKVRIEYNDRIHETLELSKDFIEQCLQESDNLNYSYSTHGPYGGELLLYIKDSSQKEEVISDINFYNQLYNLNNNK